MFAIRSRRKSISEKDFLDAVQKVRVGCIERAGDVVRCG